MSVYFIKPQGAEGPVKIGFSKPPESRLETLSTGSPVPLELELTVEAPRSYETYLHKKFSDCRIHGEWFERTSELEDLISTVRETGSAHKEEFVVRTDDAYEAEVVVTRKQPVGPVPKTISELIDMLGGNAVVASLSESSVSAVGNWRKRGVPWRARNSIARIANFRNVNLPEGYWQ